MALISISLIIIGFILSVYAGVVLSLTNKLRTASGELDQSRIVMYQTNSVKLNTTLARRARQAEFIENSVDSARLIEENKREQNAPHPKNCYCHNVSLTGWLLKDVTSVRKTQNCQGIIREVTRWPGRGNLHVVKQERRGSKNYDLWRSGCFSANS